MTEPALIFRCRHRPYLLRGYKERKYEGSKDRCVASARSILVGVQLAESLAPGMLRFWVALLFAFSAVRHHYIAPYFEDLLLRPVFVRPS